MVDLDNIKANMQDILYGCLRQHRYDSSAQAVGELMPLVERYAAEKVHAAVAIENTELFKERSSVGQMIDELTADLERLRGIETAAKAFISRADGNTRAGDLPAVIAGLRAAVAAK